jgi:hypothetical protein
MEEEAVSAEPCELVVDGRWVAAEDACDLPVRGPGDGVPLDFGEEFGSFEPV